MLARSFPLSWRNRDPARNRNPEAPVKMSDEFSHPGQHHLFHGALFHQEPGDHQHHILPLEDHIPHQDSIPHPIILFKCLQDLLVLHQCLVAPIIPENARTQNSFPRVVPNDVSSIPVNITRFVAARSYTVILAGFCEMLQSLLHLRTLHLHLNLQLWHQLTSVTIRLVIRGSLFDKPPGQGQWSSWIEGEGATGREGRKQSLYWRLCVYQLVGDTKHRPKDNLEPNLTQSVEEPGVRETWFQ
ncbi:hypothetical protein QTO34_019904 [Cnephaeus nilssonii]|uniref:Uncharacterized protein n=1 Tax=Cnephaeus nilssonii TaxID=3371016 RepID=A0AA40LMG8_CNENI|nr:hypothetical protein QTO34_019904 [Eptesicus nilssonii]